MPDSRITSNDSRERIAALPPLRQLVESHGLLAKKNLGQHFLFDLNLTDKIARKAGPLEGRCVLEIGPGPGGLTRQLLANHCDRLIVIEHDPRCLPLLEQIRECVGERLAIVSGDALETDENELLQRHNPDRLPVAVVSNLPYNIGTELLFKWLDKAELFESMTLMFQKEVAERIAAQPGGKAYGKVSVLSQWRAEVYKLFDVHPAAFFPPPKVDSTVIRLNLRKSPLAVDKNALLGLLNAAFQQRRKTLRKSLKTFTAHPEEMLARAGIDPSLRPEALSMEDFIRLANAYRAPSSN